MINYKDGRYDISAIDLCSRVTENQIAQIVKLTEKKDFSPAMLNTVDNTILSSNWDNYDHFITFLKKLVAIKQDLYSHITVEDLLTDEYWTIEIVGTSLEECHGTVVWGNQEDKLKIKKVLLAHLETTNEVLNEIVDQIISAIKGDYDDADDTDDEQEPTVEELEELEKDNIQS